jgi:hypothetical protein
MSGELIVRKYNVAVLIPAGDHVATFWCHDYARMFAWTASTRPDIGLTQVFCTGSLVPKQRNTLLKAALEDGSFTHALFMDTDHRFPKDTLLRLLSHEAPAVCVNYTKRNWPFEPVAYAVGEGWRPLYTLPESEGLERVAACGFGIVLIDLKAIKAMKEPYFMVGFNPNTKTYMGEDVYWSVKLGELGLPLMLDHDLSKEVAHIGRLELTVEHAQKYRQSQLPVPVEEHVTA